MLEGIEDGMLEGIDEGMLDGIDDGLLDGIAEGMLDGLAEGIIDGMEEGLLEGTAEGAAAARPPAPPARATTNSLSMVDRLTSTTSTKASKILHRVPWHAYTDSEGRVHHLFPTDQLGFHPPSWLARCKASWPERGSRTALLRSCSKAWTRLLLRWGWPSGDYKHYQHPPTVYTRDDCPHPDWPAALSTAGAPGPA